MAKKIYLGSMIEDLKTKIDSMVTSLQAHTTALGNINTAVSQSVSALNIKLSDNAKATLAADVPGVLATYGAYQTLKQYKLFCNGAIRIKAKVYIITNSASGYKDMKIAYSKDGSTWVDIATFTTPTTAIGTFESSVYTKDIDVAFGDKLYIGIYQGTNSGKSALGIRSGDILCYDAVDIVNSGAYAVEF